MLITYNKSLCGSQNWSSPNIRVQFASNRLQNKLLDNILTGICTKKGKKKFFGRKKLWIKCMSGVAKGKDCLGKTNKFHSCVP